MPSVIDELSFLDGTIAAFGQLTTTSDPQTTSPPHLTATPPPISESSPTQHKRPVRHHTSNSSNSSLSFSARWMPSLLSRTSTSTTSTPRESVSGFFLSSLLLSTLPHPNECGKVPIAVASAPLSLTGTLSREREHARRRHRTPPGPTVPEDRSKRTRSQHTSSSRRVGRRAYLETERRIRASSSTRRAWRPRDRRLWGGKRALRWY